MKPKSKFKIGDKVEVIKNLSLGHEKGVQGKVVEKEFCAKENSYQYDIRSLITEPIGWTDQYWHGEKELKKCK